MLASIELRIIKNDSLYLWGARLSVGPCTLALALGSGPVGLCDEQQIRARAIKLLESNLLAPIRAKENSQGGKETCGHRVSHMPLCRDEWRAGERLNNSLIKRPGPLFRS
jgi:hypothetical protein